MCVQTALMSDAPRAVRVAQHGRREAHRRRPLRSCDLGVGGTRGLRRYHEQIAAVEGIAGREHTDPQLLISLPETHVPKLITDY